MTFTGEPGDVTVINTISIKNDAAAAVVRAGGVKGGTQIVADLAERDAIPAHIRVEGILAYVISNSTYYRLDGGVSNADWNLVNIGVPGRIQVTTGLITPGNGQTLFTLPQPPVDTTTVEFYVNHAKYTNGVDYQVVGSDVTWLNVSFALDNQDQIEITYYV